MERNIITQSASVAQAMREGTHRGQEPLSDKLREGNIYFVSDAHLGSGDDSLDRERQLCRWIESIEKDCAALMLLGDMFDFWFSYRHVVPRGGVRLLGRLAEMTDRGTAVHFFLGNHDMWVFDYLEQECGIQVHPDPITYKCDGHIFLIGHGDGLGHQDPSFDIMKRVFRSRINQRLFSLLPPSLTFPLAKRWSDSNKKKHKREDVHRYLGDEREGIVIYCKERLREEKVDYCVFGHRHTPVRRRIEGGTLYVNTGDWLLNRNFAVYNREEGKLTLHDYRGLERVEDWDNTL